MRATYIAVIAAILVLGIGLAIYMGEKKEKKLDLSSETLGIPLTQEQLFKGDFSGLKPPYRVRSKQVEGWGVVYNVAYPGCSIAVQPLIANADPTIVGITNELYLPPLVSIEEKRGNNSDTVECPFKTARGIRLGSTMKEVLHAYGQPTKVFKLGLKGRVARPNLCYKVEKDSEYWLLEFWFGDDERVMDIEFKYAKTSKKPWWNESTGS
jgi:hypothetical protein